MRKITKKEIEDAQGRLIRMIVMPVTLAYINRKVDEVIKVNNEPFIRLFRLASK